MDALLGGQSTPWAICACLTIYIDSSSRLYNAAKLIIFKRLVISLPVSAILGLTAGIGP